MGTRPLPFPEQPKSPVVERRLANLEKRSLTRPQIDQQGDEPEDLEAVFSHAGSPTTDESPRWYPRITASLYEVLVSLGTAGSSDTDVEVYVNGGLQGTITLGSGVNVAIGYFSNALAANTDWLTVAVTTVGTGAENITVQARLAA